MDIKILKNLFLTIERGNPLKRQDQTTHRIMVYPGLLKCGKSGDGEHDRPGQPDKNSWNSLERVDPHRGEHLLGRTAHSARNEETIHDRTGQPASENIQGKANFEKFIVGSETTEFVNKVRNQVRIRQKRMSSNAEDCTEHSIIWEMFMATTLNAATFMGKNYSTMQNVVQNEENLTLKQMFDVTAQTIHNEDEIYCLDKVVYQKNSWTQLSLINDPVIISLQSTKVYVFSDSVLCLGKVLQHPECNQAWKDRVAGVRAEKDYSDFDDIKGESAEFEWNIFPGFTSLQLCDRISNLLSSLGQSPETFTGRILFMSMFNDISCDRHDNKVECLKNAEFVKTFAKIFGIGQWSFIGPGSVKKWYPSENSPQGAWDRVAEDMLLKFAESGHPIFRATTPLSRGQLKSKGKGKVSIHFSADQDTVDTIYRIILSVNQLSIYGAVAAICDEYEGHPDSTGEPVILEGQSIVLGEIKAEVPAHDEEPGDAQIILQQYFQQVKSLSPENRLSKFCKEAGFMSVVEVGQYFVTRNANEISAYDSLSRIHPSSRRPSFSTKRVDPRKHENWTYIGSHDKLSALQVRSRSSNSVRERRQFSFLGQNFLRNSSVCVQLHQIRHAKFGRSTRRGRCTNKIRSGCSQIEGKSKTPTKGIYWHKRPSH